MSSLDNGSSRSPPRPWRSSAAAGPRSLKFASPKERDGAIVNDAAKQLGVQPQALNHALRKALENRVDAAVAAGRLTKEQGDALKQRIEAGDVPLFVGPGIRFGHHIGPFGHGLDAAASYLGLSVDELRTQLRSGKPVADVARAQGKSGADVKQHLDRAVADGRLTQAQADEVLRDVRQRVTDRVNGKAPQFDGRRPDFLGPPPLDAPTA
jgi:polyhydroxyalkanoate synthesis regulator phasin